MGLQHWLSSSITVWIGGFKVGNYTFSLPLKVIWNSDEALIADYEQSCVVLCFALKEKLVLPCPSWPLTMYYGLIKPDSAASSSMWRAASLSSTLFISGL